MMAKLPLLVPCLFTMAVALDCNHGHTGPSPAPLSRPLPRVRPPRESRTFRSPELEKHLSALLGRSWRDPELATLLWNCLPNTLDTTVWQAPTSSDPRSFVSTGDIPAMWLRDSQNQVMPYLRYAKAEPEGVGRLIKGLLKRHIDSVLLDPYTNSFDFFETREQEVQCNPGAWTSDNTTKRDLRTLERVNGMKVGIHQRKWEMDSLSSVLKLGRSYFAATGDATSFDDSWRAAVELIIATYRAMQSPLTPDNFTTVDYTFQTLTHEPKDTSPHGIGRNHRWTGMVRTSFLPSDDSPRLPYHVPGNAFAVVELRGVATMLRDPRIAGQWSTDERPGSQTSVELASAAESLADEIAAAISKWGVVTHSSGARIFAMEVDGFGNYFFGDDANVPSLLALPFLGFVDAADATYLATRRLLLSNGSNPYFYGCGTIAECAGAVLGGIGSEDASGNAGLGHVWPLSLHIRLLTAGEGAEADEERLAILRALVESSGGTGLMHESYWYKEPGSFTRFWFAMANSFMGEVLLQLIETRPHLIFSDTEGGAAMVV